MDPVGFCWRQALTRTHHWCVPAALLWVSSRHKPFGLSRRLMENSESRGFTTKLAYTFSYLLTFWVTMQTIDGDFPTVTVQLEGDVERAASHPAPHPAPQHIQSCAAQPKHVWHSLIWQMITDSIEPISQARNKVCMLKICSAVNSRV